MPRKRRKAINTETTPDIPFQKVRVEWVDCVSDSGWATEKEFDKMNLSYPVNEGWLYEKTINISRCLHHTTKMMMVLLLGIGR